MLHGHMSPYIDAISIHQSSIYDGNRVNTYESVETAPENCSAYDSDKCKCMYAHACVHMINARSVFLCIKKGGQCSRQSSLAGQ